MPVTPTSTETTSFINLEDPIPPVRIDWIHERLAQYANIDVGYLGKELKTLNETEPELLKEVLSTPTLLKLVAKNIKKFETENLPGHIIGGDQAECLFDALTGSEKAAECFIAYGSNPDLVKDAHGNPFFGSVRGGDMAGVDPSHGVNIENPICNTTCDSATISQTASSSSIDTTTTDLSVNHGGFSWIYEPLAFFSLGVLAGSAGAAARKILLHIAEIKGCSKMVLGLIAFTFDLASICAISTLPFISTIVENLSNDHNDPLINSERATASALIFLAGVILHATKNIVKATLDKTKFIPKKSVQRLLLNLLPYLASLGMIYSNEKINSGLAFLGAIVVHTGASKLCDKKVSEKVKKAYEEDPESRDAIPLVAVAVDVSVDNSTQPLVDRSSSDTIQPLVESHPHAARLSKAMTFREQAETCEIPVAKLAPPTSFFVTETFGKNERKRAVLNTFSVEKTSSTNNEHHYAVPQKHTAHFLTRTSSTSNFEAPGYAYPRSVVQDPVPDVTVVTSGTDENPDYADLPCTDPVSNIPEVVSLLNGVTKNVVNTSEFFKKINNHRESIDDAATQLTDQLVYIATK
jgi:hypothetical protein